MRSKRRRWPAVLGLLLLGLVLGGYLAAPSLVRRYIAGHYQGVSVGAVEVHWLERRVTLLDVSVERSNLRASLPVVEVDRDKNVVITGGDVTLTMGEGQGDHSGDPPAGASITAEKLTVTVHYREMTAVLSGTRVNPNEVCFESATIQHPKVTATLLDGCVKRDKSLIKVTSVEIPLKLPFDIPDIEPNQAVEIHELEIEPEKKTARFVLAMSDDWFAIHGPATVRLADDKVFFDAPVIEVSHPWLAPYPVIFHQVGVEAPRDLKGPIEVTLGKAKVHLDLTDRALGGEGKCSEWLDVFPTPTPVAMTRMEEHFTGEMSFEVRLKPAPKVTLKTTCRYDCKAAPISEILNQAKFTYEVYNAENKMVEREAGPTVEGWASLNNMPLHVPKAFVLLEDPGFPTHHGVLPGALENSLKINVEKGGFAKGGSTITMQLAKNLWLHRTKSIGRKAEEAMLTFALESCLSKEQILELYLNVIEFGPNLYGIGPAARHYFKKDASNLTPDEAFYLASILPAPRKALPPKQGGLARARRIMKGLATSGFISEYMLTDEAPAPGSPSGWDAIE